MSRAFFATFFRDEGKSGPSRKERARESKPVMGAALPILRLPGPGRPGARAGRRRVRGGRWRPWLFPAGRLRELFGAFGGEDFDAFADVLNFGGADEDHFHGRVAEAAFADGAVDLASVGVAADADVEGAEAFLLRIFDFVWRAGLRRRRCQRWAWRGRILSASRILLRREVSGRCRIRRRG